MQLVRLTSVDSVWIWSGCAVVATNLRKKEITKRKKKKNKKETNHSGESGLVANQDGSSKKRSDKGTRYVIAFGSVCT